jgi:thiamine pyrophosphokinase
MSFKKLFSHQKFAWLFLLLIFLVPQLVCAQYTEYEVKAVYLEKFTRFIEWPIGTSISDTSRPFVLGVLGDNPFDHILEAVYKKYKIKNKNVTIKYFSTPERITECNLLYISESEKEKLNSILAKINNKPILTVSDSDGFAEKGIHINLYVKNNKLHYEINESTLIKSGFSAWAQLLSSAKIVNPVEKK